MRHTLPKGLVYEAHIKFLNGQWVVSIKMWQPPKPEQKPESRIAHGAVDTGINPHATDSVGQTCPTYYQAEPAIPLATRPKLPPRTGIAAGEVGSSTVSLRSQPSQPEVYAATPSITDRRCPLVPERGHRGWNVGMNCRAKHQRHKPTRAWARSNCQTHLQRHPVASLRSATRPPLLSIEQGLLELPDRERETQA